MFAVSGKITETLYRRGVIFLIHVPMDKYAKYQYDHKGYSLFKNVDAPRVAWVFIADEETRWEHPFHTYDDTGVLSFIMGGENNIQISNKNYLAKENDLTVMNPKVLRNERQGTAPFSEVSIGLMDLRLTPFDKDIILPTPITLVFNCDEYTGMIRKCFELIGREAVNGDYESGMRCLDSVMFVLRIIIDYVYPLNLQKYMEGRQMERSGENLVAYLVKNYIDEHYAENIRLETIAAHFYFSTHYISHEFKNFLGMPPIQYLISRRIGAAHTLLLQTDTPISVIAKEVGYTNINSFYMQFKKLKGISPSEFRVSSQQHRL